MQIEKNGKTYIVEEYPKKWTVKLESGKLAASFDVSKELCPTVAELRESVLSNNEIF